MSFKPRDSENTGELAGRIARDRAPEPDGGFMQDSGLDPAIDRVLQDFRSSAHAWSEAAYNRPGQRMDLEPRMGWMAWRKAAVWVLASMLIVVGGGGGFLEHQHRQEQARIGAAREAEHQRQIEEQRAREAEQELAKVDSEVSREVPHALEPLAQLMTDDNGQ